jgi:two-component system, NtrC family, sensor kinase
VIVLHEHNPSQAPRTQSYSALRRITTGQNVLARGRVLIVDDEPTILRAVARTLSRYHDVTTAADGDEALRILRGADPPFDAVITDIQMARVGGLELFRAIEKEIPGLAERVLFMTGGVFTGEIDQFLRSLKQRVLRKPFDPDLLRRAIDERVAMARVA